MSGTAAAATAAAVDNDHSSSEPVCAVYGSVCRSQVTASETRHLTSSLRESRVPSKRKRERNASALAEADAQENHMTPTGSFTTTDRPCKMKGGKCLRTVQLKGHTHTHLHGAAKPPARHNRRRRPVYAEEKEKEQLTGASRPHSWIKASKQMSDACAPKLCVMVLQRTCNRVKSHFAVRLRAARASMI